MKAVALLLAFASLAYGQGMSYGRAPRPNKNPDMPAGIEITQNLGAQVPLDLVFHDHHGREVKLADCVNGKPTVLVLAYFACPKLCTEVLNGLTYEMAQLTKFGWRAGNQFNVVTVSINPKDGPLMARPKRAAYLKEYDKRDEEEPGWWFLTASHGQGTNLLEAEAKVRKLAEAVGFGYKPDNFKAYDQAYAETDPAKRDVMLDTAIRKTKDYMHPSMVVILTPEGKINQYFHGLPKRIGGDNLDDGYNAEDLRKALDAANGGRVGSLLNRVAISCYAYDDMSGTYKLNMARLRWAAAPFALLAIGFVWYARRQAKRERSLTEAAPAGTGNHYEAIPVSRGNEGSA